MLNKSKIVIKTWWGSVLWESEKETVREAVLEKHQHGADLRGANEKTLPKDYINQCSRDILFILQHLKAEVPYLKEALLK